MSNVALKWMGENSRMFIGRDSHGNTVACGSWPDSPVPWRDTPGWQEFKGVKPSDLLLISAASCAAYDVVSILQRQRQQLNDLYVQVDGAQMPEPPYAFTKIHLHFVVKGVDIDEAKVRRAVELSVDKYCSVLATIRGVAEITYDFELKS